MTHSLSFAQVAQSSMMRGVDTELVQELFTDRKLPSPVMLLSRSEVRRNCNTLAKALPRAGIHYAVKSNNNQTILDEIFKSRHNFDVCSAAEIDSVLKTGVPVKSLVHTHPIKSFEEFDYAVKAGVEVFVVDNPDEVEKLRRYTDKKLKILIRYRINTNTQAVVNLQYKYGCTTEEVIPLANKITECGHHYFGLCFHIGSQCISPENYIAAITTAHELIKALTTVGYDTQLLDIGGGFPVEYIEAIPDIFDFCVPINKALDDLSRSGNKVRPIQKYLRVGIGVDIEPTPMKTEPKVDFIIG